MGKCNELINLVWPNYNLNKNKTIELENDSLFNACNICRKLSLYTNNTALMQPSFSGLLVTCAYFPENRIIFH